MNRYKVRAIVERIRRTGDFPFDVEDVVEDTESVLGFYGIHEELALDDRDLVRGELAAMAIAGEWAEAARLAEEDPLDKLLGRS